MASDGQLSGHSIGINYLKYEEPVGQTASLSRPWGQTSSLSYDDMKTITRYWLIIAILLVAIISLQLGTGIMAIAEGNADVTHEIDSLPPGLVVTPTAPLLIFISPLIPTETPTLTPSPTLTLMPTPTSTPTPLPPEPTPQDLHAKLKVPILMYHYLSVPPPNANAIRLDLSVTPSLLEAHLAYLREAGYETISMKMLSYALAGQTKLPAKPIILTFDDGYRDAYDHAFPILQKYDDVATFFVFTQPIDTYNEQFLTWEMIIEMHRAGMEFGSHSYTHPNMQGRDVDFLVYQILGSKESIEQRIGEPVRFFCYPSGHYDDLAIKVLDSANFWGAVTTQWGVEQSFDKRFEMLRIRVRGSDSAKKLAQKLNF